MIGMNVLHKQSKQYKKLYKISFASDSLIHLTVIDSEPAITKFIEIKNNTRT